MQANTEIYFPGDLLIERFETSRIIMQISADNQSIAGCDLIVGYQEILIRNFVGVTKDTENFECLWSKK